MQSGIIHHAFTSRRAMPPFSLLGVALLSCATSCVAPVEIPAVETPVRTVAAARSLLQRMALDVPALATPDLAASAVAAALPTALAPAPPFLAATQSYADADRALECLTAAVYYEARSEAVDGQRAVAQVVLNRVRDRAFPASVCGVVYQGSHRRTGCQFSFTCDGSMTARRDESAWDRAKVVAQAALAGSVYAPVGSATSYHTSAIRPWWAPSLTRIASIGAHIFYRWQSAMEKSLAFRQDYAGVEPAPAIPSTVPATVEQGIAMVQSPDVTIHRGSEIPDPRATVSGQSELADRLATDAPAAAPSRIVAGVRVHRNTMAPIDDEPI